MVTLGLQWARWILNYGIQRSRVEADFFEPLGVEPDAGARPEALAHHPTKRDAPERVRGPFGDSAASNICKRLGIGRLTLVNPPRHGERTTVPAGEPNLLNVWANCTPPCIELLLQPNVKNKSSNLLGLSHTPRKTSGESVLWARGAPGHA